MPCHPEERSDEGSALATSWPKKQIPRRYAPRMTELLLSFVHDLVVRFDDIVFRSAALSRAVRRPGTGRFAARRSTRLRLRLRVESLPRLAVRAVELLLRGADLVHVVAAERLP